MKNLASSGLRFVGRHPKRIAGEIMLFGASTGAHIGIMKLVEKQNHIQDQVEPEDGQVKQRMHPSIQQLAHKLFSV